VSIKRNSLYGLIGFALPSAIVLVAYPILVHHLGTERFGIYFLATSISSIIVLLDFGLWSATVKLLSEDLATGDERAAAATIVTSFVFYGGLGVVAAVPIWVLSPWLVSLFSVAPDLQAEAIFVFRLTSIQIIAFILITNVIYIFNVMQRFDQSTLALSALSALTYGGAIIGVTLAGTGLVGVMFISLSANVAVLFVSFLRALSLCQDQGIALGGVRPTLHAFHRMFGFGMAMAVHTITVLLLTSGLRLLVGALINPAAVAIYVLVYAAASKAHAGINAATEVMFPLSSAAENPSQLRRVYLRMLLGSGVIAALGLGSLALFAQQILTVWVGPNLAREATPLIQVFAVGFFFMALSPAPFHIANGLGRPWFNVLFDVCKVLITAVTLAVLILGGVTLADFAWAFTIANFVTALAFQTSVEILLWRRGLLTSETSSDAKV